ncbi:hypothetical protein DFJ73DRAFT_843030 [Zopfochytrium polystomum]|nr:hypothetical protein DFJ73DRAFT_843030 [Zopfochytrium polystomum]
MRVPNSNSPPGAGGDDTDWLADDGEMGDNGAEYDRTLAERAWNRMQDVHGNRGYLEGIEAGKAAAIQSGFDEGYNDSFLLGLRVGRIIGAVDTEKHNQVRIMPPVSEKLPPSLRGSSLLSLQWPAVNALTLADLTNMEATLDRILSADRVARQSLQEQPAAPFISS